MTTPPDSAGRNDTGRIRECGKVEGLDGERLAVGIEDDTVAIYVGDWLSADGCRLNAAQAEEFAALFVHAVWQAASLGASFPDEPAKGDPVADFKRRFALQQQARDLGRGIITCGGFRESGHYGAVIATYPQGSRIANEDSWRCHHDHPDSLIALECALAEVRRLAGGGAYAPCGAGEDCPDEECRRDWARLLRDETEQ